MTRWLGWFLGIENATAIDGIGLSFAAPWAQGSGFWVFLACVVAVVGAIAFYLRFQPKGGSGLRMSLGLCRGLILAMLVLTLADPILRLTVTNLQKPHLYVVVDGTDSMSIADEYPEEQRKELWKGAGWEAKSGSTSAAAPPSRMELVQSLFAQKNDNLLTKLQSELNAQVEVFVFDGATTSQLRSLSRGQGTGDKFNPQQVAEQLTTKGQVTALGTVLKEASQQFGSGRLAGVVLVSDFSHNSGPLPIGTSAASPASRLGVPIYTVGIGATETIDLAVDLQTDPVMKKAERTSIKVKLRQSGLNGERVNVTLLGRRLSGETSLVGGQEIRIGEKSVTLEGDAFVDFPYTPDEAGRMEFVAEVEKLSGEVIDQNNRATREVNIIDNYLRLMYVAHEPTWEWRFIKEVFHRDKLVGMQGFRTFLGSSDPKVRESNVLFLPTMTPKRSEFFANDVIFVDDLPRGGLSDRFGDMVKEYVGNLGGGLVIIAGPRFGPRELVGTPLADMLPVVVDPQAALRDDQEFRPRLTPHAPRYPFMQLGANEQESNQAWENLGRLQWYQPVAALHEQAFSLADHPQDKCADGKTPQPLIAVRPYGKGEVVYLGFNETWRLRRKYGEKYYRQFWSQMIYRLGMSHALGNEKRFVVRLDRDKYRTEDKVVLTVEAYNENYEPLTEETLADRTLTADLVLPANDSNIGETLTINIPLLKPGVFEARIPVFTTGEYSLRVKDPITNKYEEKRFEVTGLSAERQQAVRNEQLQTDLATTTGGRSYDLTNVSRLVNDLDVKPIKETLTRNHPLWATPLWFVSVIVLMLGEWLTRKLIKLS